MTVENAIKTRREQIANYKKLIAIREKEIKNLEKQLPSQVPNTKQEIPKL